MSRAAVTDAVAANFSRIPAAWASTSFNGRESASRGAAHPQAAAAVMMRVASASASFDGGFDFGLRLLAIVETRMVRAAAPGTKASGDPAFATSVPSSIVDHSRKFFDAPDS